MVIGLLLLLLLWCCFLLMLLGIATGILVFDLLFGDEDVGPAPGTSWKLIRKGGLL
jgi:hypothetical protein